MYRWWHSCGVEGSEWEFQGSPKDGSSPSVFTLLNQSTLKSAQKNAIKLESNQTVVIRWIIDSYSDFPTIYRYSYITYISIKTTNISLWLFPIIQRPVKPKDQRCNTCRVFTNFCANFAGHSGDNLASGGWLLREIVRGWNTAQLYGDYCINPISPSSSATQNGGTLNLMRLFWEWVFPYISLTYSLYRWAPAFQVPEILGDNIRIPSLNNQH